MMIEKYDRIGLGYNQTRKADPYLAERLLYHLQAHPKGLYLDIGCGTGNYTIVLNRKGLPFVGVEPSQQMLEIARLSPSNIDWQYGKAEAIPLADQAVDGAIASLTIHHWSNLRQGFQELYRVLKPHSRLVLFTATPKQMKGYWLNHYFPKMLQQSMEQMPGEELVIGALNDVGFKNIQQEKYFVRPDQIDLFLYAGKDRPSLYLDSNVRAGISSFADLANQEEVKEGLSQLAKDIDSGQIEAIRKQYENEDGDYLYLIVQK